MQFLDACDQEQSRMVSPGLTQEGYIAQTSGPTITRPPSALNPPEFEVYWNDDDREDPNHWPLWYKSLTIFTMSLGATVEFHITQIISLLGVTTYLLGMGAGSIVWAPLSEVTGRRPVYIGATFIFVLLILPSALASNIETILISRFFGGFFGSALMANSPASVTDIVSEEYRALAFGFWSIGPTNGPVYGPIIGGFVYQYLGWRWTNWIVLIVGGVVLALMVIIKETYAPVLLSRRAAQRRKDTQSEKWWTRYDGAKDLKLLLKTAFSRPFFMIVTEPICLFWDIYVSLVYSILYLCFVAYPIAFQQDRGWTPGIGGLSFLGIGIGVLTVIACEPLCRRVINMHTKDPSTGKAAPEAMVSIICFGSILLAIGQLWFAWTCTPDVHWVVSILAGFPFGAGTACVFIYANNYIAHSYAIFSASALAGNMIMRSIMGATLTLAGPSMYKALGLNWAGTLLGVIVTVCIAIPFAFYLYGHRIREKSLLIKELRTQS